MFVFRVAYALPQSERQRVRSLLCGLAQEPSPALEPQQQSFKPGSRVLWLYEAAGLPAGAVNRLKRRVMLEFVVPMAMALVVQIPLLSLLAVALPGVEYLRLEQLAAQRRLRFEQDYPALLLALRSSVRAGLDPLIALMNARELFLEDSVVQQELCRLMSDMESGSSEEEALARFGSSLRFPDLELFQIAFMLARREGASLGDCLERLAKVTRQRQSFRRKVQAAVAMQRLSAYGILGCVGFMLVVQLVAQPGLLKTAWGHAIGHRVLLLAGVAMFVGFVWILKLAQGRR